jgi:pyruvate formate lyase activating enzyme
MQTLLSPGNFQSQYGRSVICEICPHRCRLKIDQRGFCGVRENIDGFIHLLAYGRVISTSVDPIEKKPIRHFRPGSKVYTLATPGCTLRCKFCMNWEISQANQWSNFSRIVWRSPREVTQAAIRSGAQGIAFSYTEPGAALEFNLEIMALAHQVNLFNVWHTNGYLSEISLVTLPELLDAVCVDLKAPTEELYKKLTGGSLEPIKASMQYFKKTNVWIEVSTPILAGVNDDPEQISTMADLILQILGPNTPWHLTVGVPGWQMGNLAITSVEKIIEVERIGRTSGLKYIYAPYTVIPGEN